MIMIHDVRVRGPRPTDICELGNDIALNPFMFNQLRDGGYVIPEV